VAHGGEIVGAHRTMVTFLAHGVNVTQVLAAARAGCNQRALNYSPRMAQPGGRECCAVTPTLKGQQNNWNWQFW